MCSKTPVDLRTGLDHQLSTCQSPVRSSSLAASKDRRRFTPSRTSIKSPRAVLELLTAQSGGERCPSRPRAAGRKSAKA